MRTDSRWGRGVALRTVRVQVALIGPAEDRRRARELFEERRWEVADAREEDYPADPVPDGVIPGELSSTRFIPFASLSHVMQEGARNYGRPKKCRIWQTTPDWI